MGPKNAQKRLNIFLHLDKFMDYNEVWFSRSYFHEKVEKKSTGCFSPYRSKMRNFAEINFFKPFMYAHLRCYPCFQGRSLKIFLKPFQESKSIAWIMSHFVTKWSNVNVAYFFAHDNGSYLWSQILLYQRAHWKVIKSGLIIALVYEQFGIYWSKQE